MPTRQQVVAEASKHVGYVEGPRNNETVFGARAGANFAPWCGSFTDCMLMDAGFRITRSGGADSEPSSVYTPNGVARYRVLGRWLERNGPCQPGDIVYFDFQGSTGDPANCDHVGIVTGVRSDGQVETIEGNTSPSNSGSQANGGGVYRRVRPRSVIMGFGVPRYDAAPPPPMHQSANSNGFRRYLAATLIRDLTRAPAVLRRGMRGEGVRTLQKALNAVAGRNLSADGDFGPSTEAAVRDFQKFLGLGADGIVGPATRNMLLFALGRIEAGQA